MSIERRPVPEYVFDAEIFVCKPTVMGPDKNGVRRQIVSIQGGKVSGQISGTILSGGTDHQLVDGNGHTHLHARFGVQLDDGGTIYIDNAGIRRTCEDGKGTYFVTSCRVESYSEKYKWLEDYVFITKAEKLPDRVLQRFYKVIL